MIPPPPTPGFELRGVHVLAMFVGFFLLVIAVNTVFTVVAVRTFPGQVSESPYEDGVAYNRKLAQLSVQARLGWRVSAQAADGGQILVGIQDQRGVPVTGLRVEAKLERPATEVGRKTVRLLEKAPGTYAFAVSDLSGAWDLSVVAHGAHGARFEAERRLTWP